MADPLKSWDYLGRCYDVLLVDPLDIGSSARSKMAFDFREFENIPDGTATKPKGTDYTPASGGSYGQDSQTLSSSYDYKWTFKQDGSLTVSDPTGSLFSSTLSASYNETKREVSSNENTITFTDEIVRVYKLQLQVLETSPLELSSEFCDYIKKLTNSTTADTWNKFFKTFGTHYASMVLYGGRAFQKLVINNSDYASLIEKGINIKAEATATFEVAKVSGSSETTVTVSEEFKKAVKSSSDHIQYAGGTPQQYFDFWAQYVKDAPAPIQVELVPLYELLTEKFFPDDPEIRNKYNLLKEKTNLYISSKGEDLSKALLHYQTVVELKLVADGPPRYLCYNNNKYTTTFQKTGADDSVYKWQIINPSDPTSKDLIRKGDVIALRHIASQKYLDAQLGADDMYDRGDGLTAAKGQDPQHNSTKWKITFADNRSRLEVVNRDYLKLESQWMNPDKEYGYLLGESNYRDEHQRVFSFGSHKRTDGVVWEIYNIST